MGDLTYGDAILGQLTGAVQGGRLDAAFGWLQAYQQAKALDLAGCTMVSPAPDPAVS